MMKIAHLAYRIPGQPAGADIRNDALLAALQRLGKVRRIAIDTGAKTTHRAGAARTVLPVPESDIAQLVRELEDWSPDLVVVEGVWLMAFAEGVRKALPRCRLVIDFHNVESHLLAAEDRARSHPVLRPLLAITNGLRWHRARAADRRAHALCDAVWTCSHDDLRLLGLMASTRPADSVIANPAPRWSELEGSRTDRGGRIAPVLLFVGHLGYRPNRAAVQRLCRSIWPMVRQERPSASLVIAGRTPHRQIAALAGATAGVTLIADPQDLAPIYRQATMAVIPLADGGGTRIKALEALACGLPMVATPKAVEGLGLVDGTHFLEAASDGEIVQAVLRLAGDTALAGRIARNGHAFAIENHSQAAIDRMVHAAVRQLFPGT